MKITFIDPPVLVGKRAPERIFGCTYGLYPIPNIFILQVVALLKKEKNEVKYYNFPLDKVKKKKFIDFLKKDDSDVYCVYSVNLATKNDLLALKIIRRVRGENKVIFFGPAPTYDPRAYLPDEDTLVIRGEPEITFSELIRALKQGALNQGKSLSKIKGLSYMCKENVKHNEQREIIKNLDELPFPARELINPKKYFNPKFGGEKFTAMITSRGCPFRCKYCVPCSLSFAREIEYKKTHKQKPPSLRRSAKNVIEEFKLLKNQGYSCVSILDDEFVLGRERIVEICRGIKNLGIRWGCLSRADTLDEEVVREMSEAGCKYIDIGVESFNQKILDDIQKDLKVDAIKRAIKLTKRYRIFTKINILFGSSPLEDKGTIKESLRGLKKLRPDAVMFGVCNPFPGTEYYKIAKEKGWFVKGDYYPIDVQKESTINLPKISKKELEKEVRKANFSFYLNPGFVITNLAKIRSLKEIVNKVDALRKKLF